MMAVNIPARPMQIPPFLAAMEDGEICELTRLAKRMGGTAELLLSHSLLSSVFSFCGTENDEPILLGGVQPNGHVWMLAVTPAVERHKKWYLTESRRVVAEMRKRFPHLIANVDVRYGKSLRWLRWLGFRSIGDSCVYDVNVRHMELAR